MIVKISKDRIVNTDHIAVVKPWNELYGRKDLYDVVFACGKWTIGITLEDRDLIMKAMEIK